MQQYEPYHVSNSVERSVEMIDLTISTSVPTDTLMFLQGTADLCGESVARVVAEWLNETAKRKAKDSMTQNWAANCGTKADSVGRTVT